MQTAIKQRFTIRVTVVFVFILGTLLTASLAIGLQYYFASSMATTAAKHDAAQIAKNTQREIEAIDNETALSVATLARHSQLIENGQVNQPVADKLFSELLKNTPKLYAVYIGQKNGDFYELINLEASQDIRDRMQASLLDRYAKVIIQGQGSNRSKTTIFLTESLLERKRIQIPSDYYASERPWYKQARHNRVNKTKPYLFQHLQAPGQTYTMQIEDQEAVIAADIALSTMSSFLDTQLANANKKQCSKAYIFSKDGEIIASNQTPTKVALPQIKPLPLSAKEYAYIKSLNTLRVSNERDWAPLDYSISGEPRGYLVELMNIIAQKLNLSIEFTNGVSWNKLVDYYQDGHIEILSAVNRTAMNQHWGLYSEPLLEMPIGLATAKSAQNYRSLEQLNGKRIAIPQGWSVIPAIKQAYPEIDIVQTSSNKEALEKVLNAEAEAALDSEIILNYMINSHRLEGLEIQADIDIFPVSFDSSARVVVKPEYKPLRDLINKAIASLSPLERNYLTQKWLNTSVLAEAQASAHVPHELLSFAENSEQMGQLQHVTLNNKKQLLYLAPLLKQNGQYLAILMDSNEVLKTSRREVLISTGFTVLCMICILPVSWLLANPIVKPVRKLAEENRKIMARRYDEVSKTPSVIKELDDLSDSMLQMSAAISKHEAQQQQLMDSFIELIAQAIDDKSPYTAGHCNRVPELGLLLAEAASQDNSEHFAEFSLVDKHKSREFRLAAWLHDCGKITTPDYIVDKATKLETCYNRIHEIRTRFEVLWRDAEIHSLKASIANPEQQQQLAKECAEKQALLQQDFAFVARCNIGGEFMTEEQIQRLHHIGQTTWMRYFDDRLGLSIAEEDRLKEIAPSPVPAIEQLLADKPHHQLPRVRNQSYDPKLGIQMEIPRLLADHGELYNLAIRRGTLTTEDRFIINEHVLSTIKMLESLPFPKELANVPRYASTHHETLKGTGYPRKLSKEDLSIGERILVLSDIFEALTASDRPYKRAKPLSVSIDILFKMCQDQHIDIEVFKLFLTSGVYLEYAQKFLSPEQIDEVDIERYLNSSN